MAHTESQEDPPLSSGWDRARWALMLLLLLVLIAVVVESNLTSHLRVCTDTAARIGKNATVRICHPLSATDAPVILALVLIGCLLIPDVSKIGIGGVIELERSVKEQKQRTDDLEKKIETVAKAEAVAQTIQNFNWPGLAPDEALPFDTGKFDQKAGQVLPDDDVEPSS